MPGRCAENVDNVGACARVNGRCAPHCGQFFAHCFASASIDGQYAILRK
jgi:hypothetical protein